MLIQAIARASCSWPNTVEGHLCASYEQEDTPSSTPYVSRGLRVSPKRHNFLGTGPETIHCVFTKLGAVVIAQEHDLEALEIEFAWGLQRTPSS